MEVFLKFISLYIFMTSVNGNSEKFLNCRLVWKYAGVGDHVSSDAVAAQSGVEYIVRALDPDDIIVLGTFSATKREANFPFQDDYLNTTSSSLTNFEILTNPHTCIISWRQHTNGESPPSFLIPVEESSAPGLIIGRGYVQGLGWLSGGVDLTAGTILIPAGEETIIMEEYQILTSYSEGLRLDATNFEFATDPFDGQLSSVGNDDIINNSDMEISKKTRHYKRLVEVSSVSTTASTTSTKTKSSGFDIGIVASKRKVEHSYKESVTESFKTTRVTEIIIEKELIIPPFSNVTACSTVTILDKFVSDFTARGVYSAPGMTVEEVLALLEDEGITGPTIVIGDSGLEEVVVELHGTFEGSLSLDSQFVAVPFGQSCTEMQNQVYAKKVARIMEMKNSGF